MQHMLSEGEFEENEKEEGDIDDLGKDNPIDFYARPNLPPLMQTTSDFHNTKTFLNEKRGFSEDSLNQEEPLDFHKEVAAHKKKIMKKSLKKLLKKKKKKFGSSLIDQNSDDLPRETIKKRKATKKINQNLNK